MLEDFCLFKSAVFALIIGIFSFWIFRKIFGISTKGIPGIDLHFFNIIGHAYYIPRKPIHLKLCNVNAYFLQTLWGFGQLHSKDNMYLFWILNNPFVVLHKAESIEALYSSTTMLDKAVSYNLLHPWLGTGLLTSSRTKWKSRRKLLTPSFHFNILKEFLPVMNEQSEILVQIIKESIDKEWIDIVDVMTSCSLDIICETTLGTSINAQRRKTDYVKALLRTSESIIHRMVDPSKSIDFLYYRTEAGKQLKKDIRTLHAFTNEVIRKKRKLLEESTGMTMTKDNDDDKKSENGIYRKRKALMDLLLDYHMTHKDFTEEDIREEVDTFTFEGHDTTAMGLTWTLYLIGLYPEVQKLIHEELDRILPGNNWYITNEDLGEMKYLQCVIKESLRLYPSVPITGRQCTEDFILCGVKIPKGATIAEFIYGLHRDPEIFPNPELFDPDRFLSENANNRHAYAYTPFAAGPRNCIGQRFAMMELKIVLAAVLKHFTAKSLDPRDKIVPCIDLVLRPGGPIRVKFVSRTN